MPQTDFDLRTLPPLPGHTHCVLIPRDPEVVYAYWHCNEDDINRTRQQIEPQGQDVQLVLRVYDLNTNNSKDIDIGLLDKAKHIFVGADNADYCAQIGLRSSDGNFSSLTRSNTVHTPPKGPSSRNDLIWQDIKFNQASLPYLKESLGDQELLGPKATKKRPRVYQLSLQDIRNYYRDLFSRMSRKSRRRLLKSRLLSMEDIVKGLPRGVSWQKARPIMSMPDLIKDIHPGSSAGSYENKGASERLTAPGLVSSEGRLNKREFFFEVWTELIVHGRTEPGARLVINDQGIGLNPDGTFSLRYALADGQIPLKFIAQSPDGVEERHINTQVEREKTISFPKMLKGPHG
ncbi:MAG: DUF4912 domain-containing protein [Candidatus Omnitrophica bacterium]|nr:DUF4912 domain-containing protein [Candidatus Omnitrophota bacterium]